MIFVISKANPREMCWSGRGFICNFFRIVSYLYVVNNFFLLYKINIFFLKHLWKDCIIWLHPGWIQVTEAGVIGGRGASCRETPFIGVLYARYVQDAVSKAKHCSQLYNYYLCVVSSSLFLFIAWHVVRIEDIEGGSHLVFSYLKCDLL